MSKPPSALIKILFLAANPADTDRLQLDEEVRAIEQQLRAADLREQFELKQHWAVRYSDLHELFIRYTPTIVHFSGHGTAQGELLLMDEDGNAMPVPAEALANLFAIFHPSVRCAVLNACYTASQAEGIARHVACVVGTNAPISDEAAIDFAAGFYLGVGSGFSVQKSFDVGRNRIELGGGDEEDALHLLCPAGNPDEIIIAQPKPDLSEAEKAELAAAYAKQAAAFPPLTPARRGCYGSVGRFSVSVVLSAVFVALVGGWLWNNLRPGAASYDSIALEIPTISAPQLDQPTAGASDLAQGEAALAAGDYAAAIAHLTAAAQAAQDAGESTLQSEILLRVGEAQIANGDFAAAEDAYERAVALVPASGSREVAKQAWAALGNIYVAQGESARAREAYRRALDIARTQGDEEAAGLLLLNLAGLEAQSGALEDADRTLNEALNSLEGVEVKPEVQRDIESLQQLLPRQ